jgi:hypothetical protein
MIEMSSVAGVVDSVRNIILNWSLKLEEEGILGEDLAFTSQDIVSATAIGNVTNFYGPVEGSQILQAGPQSTQIVHFSNIDLDSLKSLLATLRGLCATLELPSDGSSELEAELKTLEAQLVSPKPKQSIIRESLTSVGRVLESAAGGAAAHVVIEIGKLLAL